MTMVIERLRMTVRCTERERQRESVKHDNHITVMPDTKTTNNLLKTPENREPVPLTSNSKHVSACARVCEGGGGRVIKRKQQRR